MKCRLLVVVLLVVLVVALTGCDGPEERALRSERSAMQDDVKFLAAARQASDAKALKWAEEKPTKQEINIFENGKVVDHIWEMNDARGDLWDEGDRHLKSVLPDKTCLEVWSRENDQVAIAVWWFDAKNRRLMNWANPINPDCLQRSELAVAIEELGKTALRDVGLPTLESETALLLGLLHGKS